MKKSFLIAMALSLLLAVGTAWVAEESSSEKHSYIGVDSCKLCHIMKSSGAQYKKWKEMKHSKAYETLGSEEAKKIAKEKGIDDPQQSMKCLKCHVTAIELDESRRIKKWSKEDGVGCETCHGPGSDYYKKEIMKDREKSLANGLILPDEKLCRSCHNEESPTFKEFNFKEAWDKIKHPIPEKEE